MKTQSHTSFTSNVHPNMASIKKYMPKQLNSITNSILKLWENGVDDDVYIRAVSKKLMDLKVQKIDKSELSANISDAREIAALEAKMLREDCEFLKYGFVPDNKQAAFESLYKQELNEIRKTPFDFGKEILTTYERLYNPPRKKTF